MAKKRVSEPEYPHIKKVISLRCKQLYGSVSALAARLGLSRQALHCRIRSASRWFLTHHWWSAVLFLPIHLLVTNDLSTVCVDKPTDAEISLLFRRERAIWDHAYAMKGTWGVHQRIAE